MRSGIDYRLLKAELDTADVDARRRRLREVAAWIRASGKPHAWRIRLGLGLSALGIATLALGILLTAGRPIMLVGILVTAVAGIINLMANRSAVQWRRTHPFAQWHASPERDADARD